MLFFLLFCVHRSMGAVGSVEKALLSSLAEGVAGAEEAGKA